MKNKQISRACDVLVLMTLWSGPVTILLGWSNTPILVGYVLVLVGLQIVAWVTDPGIRPRRNP